MLDLGLHADVNRIDHSGAAVIASSAEFLDRMKEFELDASR